MPTIRIALEHAAVPVHKADATWAVHCPSCSQGAGEILSLGAVTLSLENAQRLADRHNRVVHGIER
ncbi:MAG: hypothetical protein ABSG81_05230 [Acidimicrobiales bacterium]|jgi:hypothetical protein